ncbi:hypothetical protein KBX71_07660 [Micromonospora sp. D93]|uniref:hypothetical protein n=1 Tax=Micromonospora sp. D93 TaxID=2824886 RepID=UPI001B3644DF|nr:hypothetical protein [Micromonospora sp. D93]MBQ1017745.1 hypothetical protein [Micromonospora sp. D93]
MEPDPELDRLRERVVELEAALRLVRRQLFDARSRLAAISRITDDLGRAERAPGVTFGSVNSILNSERPPLRRITRWSPVRYRGVQR